MKRISVFGYEWMCSEPWGLIHPELPHQWYDESAVEVMSKKELNLKTHYNPRYFENIGDSLIGVGMVSSVEKFGHGYFEVEVNLPDGANMWPAFWLYGENWPPEIDCFEAYSNKRGSYFKWNWKNPLAFWNIQSNLHYGTMEDHKSIRGKKHILGRKNFTNPKHTFIHYAIDWQKDYVKFYYNHNLVRKVTRGTKRGREILDQLNLENGKMKVLINNGTQAIKSYDDRETIMMVRNFKFLKHKPL